MAKTLFFGLFSSISLFTPGQGNKANKDLINFFIQLDDQHNRAMEQKDSATFAYLFADKYINCTPNGEINDKQAEISTLIHGSWKSVERVASQFDIFAFSDVLTSLTLTKKIRIDSPSGENVLYVRRTTVYQKIDCRWQAIAGQGTIVSPRYVEN
ncbi:nuclear transport factor 2 family protein [Dyadobacter arcticus]|uniref:DUF4440 domain-containing protein n=1 Tax=Dyadobacter arcticus TaxID=1078754 RepID=A0ABX0UKH8_9BACT|nr:nuclear transport factor 2 family protein [Dyadobacter arcticus]NIJ52978.1 hypothetical protein [Dyadobacter arcticus]